jgi:hypothetical protein
MIVFEGSARTTTRGILIVTGILIFARIYFIINENKKFRKNIITLQQHPQSMDNVDVEEIPFLFGMFLLILAGMPILR